MKKYCIESTRRGISYIQQKEGRLIGVFISFVGRERRRKQLLDDLKGTRGCCKLKDEALDGSAWRIRFVRGCGHVVRQTTEWMSE
jgi:hypothetical protein